MLLQSWYKVETVLVPPQHYFANLRRGWGGRVVVLQYVRKEHFNTSISEWYFN